MYKMAQEHLIFTLFFGLAASQDQGHSLDLCPDIPVTNCTHGPTAVTPSAWTATSTATSLCPPGYCVPPSVCVPVLGRPVCACAPGTHGTHCQINATAAASSTPATAATTPKTVNTTATTTAVTATTATACALQLCAAGSTCIPQGATFSCVCPPDRTGVTCHRFTNHNTTVTSTFNPTTPSAPVCDRSMWDGCQEADVVFMLSNSHYENRDSVHTEGEFVKALVSKYGVNTRVAVVIYHDTVSEPIKLTDYANDRSGLLHHIDRVTIGWGLHTGEPDLAKALVHVRDVTLKSARASARRIIIPVVHAMRGGHQAAEDAARDLKDQCAQIWVAEVPRPIGWGLHSGQTIATSPDWPYYQYHYTLQDLVASTRLLQIHCH